MAWGVRASEEGMDGRVRVSLFSKCGLPVMSLKFFSLVLNSLKL